MSISKISEINYKIFKRNNIVTHWVTVIAQKKSVFDEFYFKNHLSRLLGGEKDISTWGPRMYNIIQVIK